MDDENISAGAFESGANGSPFAQIHGRGMNFNDIFVCQVRTLDDLGTPICGTVVADDDFLLNRAEVNVYNLSDYLFDGGLLVIDRDNDGELLAVASLAYLWGMGTGGFSAQ